jgi:hypothetical protein
MDETRFDPLVREVPGHLFHFEEKIFGMRLSQLLTDLCAGLGLVTLFGRLALLPRLALTFTGLLLTLVLVHATFRDATLLSWLARLAHARFIPRRAIWRRSGERARKGAPASVQDHWLPPLRFAGGFLEIGSENTASLCAIIALESRHTTRYLAQEEQIRLYERIKTLLDGLDFPFTCLTLVETGDPARDPALALQEEAVTRLPETSGLARLQQASLSAQRAQLQRSTRPRHFLVLSARAAEVARWDTGQGSPSVMATILALVAPTRGRSPSRAQVLDLLRARLTLIEQAMQPLDVRLARPDEATQLAVWAACLAPGNPSPSFAVEVLEETGGEPRRWKKHIEGVQGAFVYQSAHREARLVKEALPLSDLLAPSEVIVHPDDIMITCRSHTRFLRFLSVTDLGASLRFGWTEELLSSGLPLLVQTHYAPLDSVAMIKRLEQHLVKLESQREADRQARRISKAAHTIEAEQVRAVIEALARKKLKIFTVQMRIGLHASSQERLEQRTGYLLAHLRELGLSAEALTFQQDRAWQASLPTGVSRLDNALTLPSDVLATFFNWSAGGIGTPTGAYLGTTGTGLARLPVYLNPWDERERLPNPHMVICGESGMGKSWLVKVLVTGLLGLGVADAVILDRDGDYDLLHEHLLQSPQNGVKKADQNTSLPLASQREAVYQQNLKRSSDFAPGSESQRFNLAGSCPINLFDLPYGPEDVNLDDPADLLSEAFAQHVLVGLALLYGEPFTRTQEAYLTHILREMFARRGITSEAIRRDPNTLLTPAPVFADFLRALHTISAPTKEIRTALCERFETVAPIFPGETTVSISTPLTIFNIHALDERWYPLMIYVVQTFLRRHRALRRDDRYLLSVVEEASYLLKHPTGKRYLESGSRGFRKLGIAQLVISQHPEDFLTEGKVIIGNAGTCFFLGMQRHTARTLHLPDELERVLEAATPGRAVMRCGKATAALDITSGSPLHRMLLTTDPVERRALSQRKANEIC